MQTLRVSSPIGGKYTNIYPQHFGIHPETWNHLNCSQFSILGLCCFVLFFNRSLTTEELKHVCSDSELSGHFTLISLFFSFSPKYLSYRVELSESLLQSSCWGTYSCKESIALQLFEEPAWFFEAALKTKESQNFSVSWSPISISNRLATCTSTCLRCAVEDFPTSEESLTSQYSGYYIHTLWNL